VAPLDAIPPERITTLRIGPLPVDAVLALIEQRLDAHLPRPVAQRVHDTAAGHPLYALELARAVTGLEIVPAPGPRCPCRSVWPPSSTSAFVACRRISWPSSPVRRRRGG
jgi:hypothetical protein